MNNFLASLSIPLQEQNTLLSLLPSSFSEAGLWMRSWKMLKASITSPHLGSLANSSLKRKGCSWSSCNCCIYSWLKALQRHVDPRCSTQVSSARASYGWLSQGRLGRDLPPRHSPVFCVMEKPTIKKQTAMEHEDMGWHQLRTQPDAIARYGTWQLLKQEPTQIILIIFFNIGLVGAVCFTSTWGLSITQIR